MFLLPLDRGAPVTDPQNPVLLSCICSCLAAGRRVVCCSEAVETFLYSFVSLNSRCCFGSLKVGLGFFSLSDIWRTKVSRDILPWWQSPWSSSCCWTRHRGLPQDLLDWSPCSSCSLEFLFAALESVSASSSSSGCSPAETLLFHFFSPINSWLLYIRIFFLFVLVFVLISWKKPIFLFIFSPSFFPFSVKCFVFSFAAFQIKSFSVMVVFGSCGSVCSPFSACWGPWFGVLRIYLIIYILLLLNG